MSKFIHPTAEISTEAFLEEGVRIWHWSQVREGARIGMETRLGKGVYIDRNVSIGARVKIQNHVSIYEGVEVEDGVFIGANVCFANDRFPRAVMPDGTLKGRGDWITRRTLLKRGCAIGSQSAVLCDLTIGAWAMVAMGSVVTADVPDFGFVLGNPARLSGYVCKCGNRLEAAPGHDEPCRCILSPQS